MGTAGMADLVGALTNGNADDGELLDRLGPVLADPAQRDRLRAAWPTDKLPIVNDYFCVARLGQGGSGVVFKAITLRDQPVFVALKLLKFDSPEAEERFQEREIEILKSLDCPFVARALDSGVAGGTRYVALELVAGLPLDEYLASHAPRLEDKLAVFRRLCGVVAGLHAAGVIHRDLKPKHVLVDATGQPWLVDFGLSAVRGDDWPTRVRRARTELGRILGTLKYMSPEQAWGGIMPVDHRADIWSLGIMLYEIVTAGDYPYDLGPYGDLTGYEALLHRIQTERPRKPRIGSSRFAEPLTTLISRCLTHEADRRMDSAATLADDLDRCLAHRPIETKGLPLGYRLGRITIGLTARWRYGLWASTVGAVLLFLFSISQIFGVRWQVAGVDYGRTTRHALAGADVPADDGIIIAAISDETVGSVPSFAASNGMADVTGDLKTWRAVHGRLMERLAQAGPRALIWDFFFRTPQPGDPAFVSGALALQRAGVPLVLAVRRYEQDQRPELSAALFGPLADGVGHGLILARDMVLREGEIVLALRRADNVYPALILSAFASVVHPGRRTTLDWRDSEKTIRLICYQDAATGREPTVDPIELTTVFENPAYREGTRPGDLLACKAFPLQPPAYWERRTVPYEDLLRADARRLSDLVAGKIILVGDLRKPSPRFSYDRHPVRYGMRVIDDVPGCYLVADGLNGLLANRSLRSGSTLSVSAFVGVAVFSLLACLLPPRLALNAPLTGAGVQRAVLAGLLLAAGACTVVLVFGRTWPVVHAGMFGAAVCAAMAVSFAIEFTRNRYRIPLEG